MDDGHSSSVTTRGSSNAKRGGRLPESSTSSMPSMMGMSGSACSNLTVIARGDVDILGLFHSRGGEDVVKGVIERKPCIRFRGGKLRAHAAAVGKRKVYGEP